MDLIQLIWSLLLDTTASWLRMFVALAISIVISLFVGIWAARSERIGRIVLPIVDVLQTLPILAFFPFVIYVVLYVFPPFLGINAAVIFLIITSMIWNLIFGVYEAVKTLPNEFLDVANLYKMGLVQRLRKVYIPAAMPRLAEQSVLSWSIGLFYLVTSEIFSTGSSSYSVSHGIGVALTQLALSGSFLDYGIGLAIFILFVIATRFLVFMPMERHFSKPYKNVQQKQLVHRFHEGTMHRFRLFHEIETMYKKSLADRITKRIKNIEKNPKVQKEMVPAFMEMHRQRSLRAQFYFIIVLVLILALLVSVGIINYTTALDEEMALVALAASFARVWITFLVITIVAVPLCVYLIFMSKKIDRYITLFQVLASIPATIVLPIIVVLLSGYAYHDELVAFAVFFLSGIWYVIFSVVADARSLQSNVFEVKRIFQVKGTTAWKKIYLLAIAPGLITGAVTGIAAEWNASIVAEYFTSTGVGAGNTISSVGIGMGKLLDVSLANGNLTLMLIALINLTIMIILINTFVWKRLYKRVSDVYK